MVSHFGFCQLVILLLSVEFSTVSCDTFYIVTSPSSPCPGEYIGVPCLTLQQYASNPSRSQNITFIIEPGMYNLSTVLTVSDGYNFTMSSTNATVTCTSATARFEFNRVQNVHISGMTFRRCRNTAITMSQVTSATIMRSTFTGNQALSGSSRSGGCLYIVSSSTVTISESEFRNNRASHSGGAIYASLSTVGIKRSQFSYNTQEYRLGGNGGGAIYTASSNITINGSKFTHNNVRSSGGGAICMRYSGNLQIINTTLTGNRAYDSYFSYSGGAIYTTGLISAIVIQCQFINNYANGNGGGLYNAGGSLIVTQTNFSSNSAREIGSGGGTSGGGIYKTGGTLTTTECNFFNNIASESGGAMYMYVYNTVRYNNYYNSLSVIDCHFSNNNARGSGGAIYKIGSNDIVEIGRNTYNNNTAYSFGGAVT